jgi:hypothetical protein
VSGSRIRGLSLESPAWVASPVEAVAQEPPALVAPSWEPPALVAPRWVVTLSEFPPLDAAPWEPWRPRPGRRPGEYHGPQVGTTDR